MRTRKSAAQTRADQEEKAHRARAAFMAELRAAQTRKDAEALAFGAPRPDAPGRAFYSNLQFFLANSIPPRGASIAELAEYRRLAATFDLAPDARQTLVDALSDAMDR